MNSPILVSQDVEGLHDAALELFERSMHADGVERTVINASMSGDLKELERVIPERSFSPGYLSFLCYLIWLEGIIEVGSEFRLYADEAEGLRMLRRARDEFEREHPRCCACGVPQITRFAKSCCECGQKFRG